MAAAAVAQAPAVPAWLRSNSGFASKIRHIGQIFQIDLSDFNNSNLPPDTTYTPAVNGPDVFDTHGNFAGVDDENMLDFESQHSDENDGEEDKEREAFLQQGRDHAGESSRVATVVPFDIAMVSQKLSIDLRAQWKQPNFATLLPKVKEANEKIQDISFHQKLGIPFTQVDGSVGVKHEKYKVNGRGIYESISLVREAILATLQPSFDARQKEGITKAMACECASLGASLDQCGLTWKSVTDPDVRNVVEHMVNSVHRSLPMPQQEAILNFSRRDAMACSFQSAHVDKVIAPLQDLQQALKNDDRRLVSTKMKEIKEINNELRKYNKEVGFKEDNRLLPCNSWSSELKTFFNPQLPRQSTVEEFAQQFGRMLSESLMLAGYAAQVTAFEHVAREMVARDALPTRHIVMLEENEEHTKQFDEPFAGVLYQPRAHPLLASVAA